MTTGSKPIEGELRKYAMCGKCGCYYPPERGHSATICEQIFRWKYPSRALTKATDTESDR